MCRNDARRATAIASPQCRSCPTQLRRRRRAGQELAEAGQVLWKDSDVVMCRSGKHEHMTIGRGGNRRDQRVRACPRDDLVTFSDNDEYWGCHVGYSRQRVESIPDQPARWEPPEVVGGYIGDTVVRSNERKSLNRSSARQCNGHAASEAASDYRDAGMSCRNPVIKMLGVGDQCGLRWVSGASVVAAVIHEVDRAIDKRSVEVGQVLAHALGIASEVDQRVPGLRMELPDLESGLAECQSQHPCFRALLLFRRVVKESVLDQIEEGADGRIDQPDADPDEQVSLHRPIRVRAGGKRGERSVLCIGALRSCLLRVVACYQR
jgi:hypothetical protein